MKLVSVKGSCPPKQYGQALVLDGLYLYTVGGTTGFDYTADIHRLNLRTGIWEEVYICKGSKWREPKGRYRHELAFDGTRIYLLGGGTAEEVYGFQVMQKLLFQFFVFYVADIFFAVLCQYFQSLHFFYSNIVISM
jgi:hypothetical protein